MTVKGQSPLLMARTASGFSRERAARQLDPPVSSKTIERWETGETNPRRWQLLQLAKIYEVEPHTLNGKAPRD